MGGTEGELLHLSEVVAGIPVKGQLTHRVQGELRVRPDLHVVHGVIYNVQKVLNKSSYTLSLLKQSFIT